MVLVLHESEWIKGCKRAPYKRQRHLLKTQEDGVLGSTFQMEQRFESIDGTSMP